MHQPKEKGHRLEAEETATHRQNASGASECPNAQAPGHQHSSRSDPLTWTLLHFTCRNYSELSKENEIMGSILTI